jgi:hypothetical protein
MHKADLLNSIGLVLAMIGVVIVFFFGPPQPPLEPGVNLALEDLTPIDESGKTVAEYNREVEAERRRYSRLSKFGLALIFLGFAFQLCSIWWK